MDKETQMPAGMLIVGRAEAHKWKANEAYFLQAIGDQMLMSVSHTRLRSLVRRMGVSDERSGLLSRSSYQSCLLTEADRARTQSTPLALTILQIDRDRKSTRLNSSHSQISYAVFCLQKKQVVRRPAAAGHDRDRPPRADRGRRARPGDRRRPAAAPPAAPERTRVRRAANAIPSCATL